MIRRERLTATLEGDFVVFLIGLRVNNLLKLHKWVPVARAMPRMIKELEHHPELGFLHAETWFARTIIVVQYWRSMPQLFGLRQEQAGRTSARLAILQQGHRHGRLCWHMA
jgi:Domain of unknown function (DUF4188)